MDKPKHTPGPWSLAQITGFPSSLGVGIDGSPAIAVLTLDAHRNEVHQKANARLIAAAPDLLEACRDAHYWLSAYHRGQTPGFAEASEALEKVEKAIQKAVKKS